MNKNEVIIIFVLCILLILVIMQIFKTKKKEQFYNRFHSQSTCRQFPFTFDKCSENEYTGPIGDIHVNYNRDAFETHYSQKIHMVNPLSPCCLRTCINDFTYTKENTDPTRQSEVAKIGQYKEFINKNLYFASKCNMCLDNYFVALKRLSTDQTCENNQVENNNLSRNGCDKQL